MKFIDSLIVMTPSIVGALYFVVGACYVIKKDYAWAMVWAAYGLATFGLVLIGLRK
tara:strand:- start:243 stop:410 length:168 start_codon:yes stop_codon:yes gene_type:complete